MTTFANKIKNKMCDRIINYCDNGIAWANSIIERENNFEKTCKDIDKARAERIENTKFMKKIVTPICFGLGKTYDESAKILDKIFTKIGY